MTRTQGPVLYLDASAILSVLFEDEHTSVAIKRVRAAGTHLLSSLARAEVHAVIARLEREQTTSRDLIATARDVLSRGPWRRLNAVPDWESVESLAQRWPLRGADLWHLALAASLRAELPELALLSFDRHLRAAAEGEDLA